ncbi:MAG: allophanate hydrolase [Ketobacteraceae bacterium]|nr:allophanate hydrolase [Ketobacteraceae bacterium]
MGVLSIKALREGYLSGELSPDAVIMDCLAKIEKDENSHAWIATLPAHELKSYLRALAQMPIEDHPLWGIPFAVKDNIDLAGCATTAACPDFAYQPDESAFVVKQLIAAGAVPLGKTNMDQFATGLVGTRSPYGAVPCIYNDKYISGGSSSGSAYAVASGQVAFSLGTDTAGSGRVPAAFNGLIGVKPTRGLLSCRGVVPACRSLDCVSIFANTLADANEVLAVASTYDEQDAYARQRSFITKPASEFTVGVPSPDDLYTTHPEYQTLFNKVCDALRKRNVDVVEIDFKPFSEAARLLYQGPWVAERYHAVGEFIERHQDRVDESVATIIRGAKSVTGYSTFDGFYKLQNLKRLGDQQLERVDCIMTPTTPTQYTHEEIAENPILNNTELGYYNNFMNLLDYAALAVPGGHTSDGLGFGVTFFADAQTDLLLQQVAGVLLEEKTDYLQSCFSEPDVIPVAVCGAHLEGMPLNWQLTKRYGTLSEKTTTAPCYQFYALAGGPPFRPGLQRVEEGGQAIDVEVWNVPARYFGSFVAGIPAPLGIGKLELADGRWVPGFICEPCGLAGAVDITDMGSWREYMKHKL